MIVQSHVQHTNNIVVVLRDIELNCLASEKGTALNRYEFSVFLQCVQHDELSGVDRVSQMSPGFQCKCM